MRQVADKIAILRTVRKMLSSLRPSLNLINEAERSTQRYIMLKINGIAAKVFKEELPISSKLNTQSLKILIMQTMQFIPANINRVILIFFEITPEI